MNETKLPVTIYDVSSNTYVNHFDEIAAQFGLEGCYYQYFTDESHGMMNVYFVCGLNSSLVSSGNLDLAGIAREAQQQSAFINTQIAAFKISGEDVLLTHQRVMEYCQLVEFLKKAHEERNIKMPTFYPKYIAQVMVMAHGHSQNPHLPPNVRDAYRKTVEYNLKKQAKLLPKDNPSKKELFYLCSNYDTSRSSLSNWFKCYFSRHKNKVSFEHLIRTSAQISTFDVRYTHANIIERELANHREILYWISKKPEGAKLNCDNELGFRSQKANDTRTLTLCCDSEYRREVFDIINRCEYPDAYRYTLSQLVDYNDYIHKLTIQESELDKYITEFKSLGLDYCISTTDKPEVIEIAVGSHKQSTVQEIVEKLQTRAEQTHLYTNSSEQDKFEEQYFHDKRQYQLNENLMDEVKKITNSDSVEIVHSYGDWRNAPAADTRDYIDDDLCI